MTPKEKAADLVDKFQNVEVVLKFSDRFLYKHKAMQCALIAVDEILDDDMYGMEEESFEKRINYWEEVKKEIEAL